MLFPRRGCLDTRHIPGGGEFRGEETLSVSDLAALAKKAMHLGKASQDLSFILRHEVTTRER
jgi:hypothetical protein